MENYQIPEKTLQYYAIQNINTERPIKKVVCSNTECSWNRPTRHRL